MKMLDEAEDFFTESSKNLSDMEYLLIKAAAISWTKESVKYQMKNHFNKNELNSQEIKEAVRNILSVDFSWLLETKKVSLEEEFYFYGGIWLAIWILKGDKKQIEWYKNLKKTLMEKF